MRHRYGARLVCADVLKIQHVPPQHDRCDDAGLLCRRQSIEGGDPARYRCAFEDADRLDQPGKDIGVARIPQLVHHEGNGIVARAPQFHLGVDAFLVGRAQVADVLADAGRVAEELVARRLVALDDLFNVRSRLLVHGVDVGPARHVAQRQKDGGAVFLLKFQEIVVVGVRIQELLEEVGSDVELPLVHLLAEESEERDRLGVFGVVLAAGGTRDRGQTKRQCQQRCGSRCDFHRIIPRMVNSPCIDYFTSIILKHPFKTSNPLHRRPDRGKSRGGGWDGVCRL